MLQALSALVGLDLLPPQPDAGPAAAAILQQPSATAFGAPTAEQLLLERVPQCARRLACRLFRIFTPRVPCSNATSRRGAAAYGDDNTFLFLAETLERAPLWVSQLVARTFFTQLFVYVTMAHLYRCVSISDHLDHIPPFLKLSGTHVPVGYKTWSPPQGSKRAGSPLGPSVQSD